jgi:uncharacterized membrane protein
MSLPTLPGLDWHPLLPLTAIVLLVAIAACSAVIFTLGTRVLRTWAKLPALLLRLGAIAALGLIALNPVSSEKSKSSPRSASILIDDSMSMALGTRMVDASSFVRSSREKFGPGPLQISRYGEKTQPLGTEETLTPAGRVTHLGSALRQALDAQPVPASILICGDGGSHDRRELDAAASLAKARGIPIHVHPVGGSDPLVNAWISGIKVPPSSRPKSSVPCQVWISSHGISQALTLKLLDHGGTTVTSRQIPPSAEPTSVALELNAGIRTEGFQLVLEQAPQDLIPEDNTLSFQLEVTSPKTRILYMEGTHASHQVTDKIQSATWNAMQLMSRAWEATGEMEVDCYSPISQYSDSANLYKIRRFLGGGLEFDRSHAFPATRDELFNYDVVISSDIPQGNFSDEQKQWVVDLVTRRGGGFCMIGGNTSFDSGNYDQTSWEKITPVDMVDAGHGINNNYADVVIPNNVRKHPIWQLDADHEKNELLLEAHPPFLGYHDIRRAKPGAVVLAQYADVDAPLIAVQSYGLGRSMAFLSDSNGGWGEQYITWGSEASGATVSSGREIGQGGSILESTAGMTEADAVPAAMPHPSPPYAQFWVNTVRWLAEYSIRRSGEGIRARAEDSCARPGQMLAISAEITAAVTPEEMASLSVSARLVLPGGSVQRLEWDRNRREFIGSLEIPTDLTVKDLTLSVECQTATRLVSDHFSLPVLALNPEIEQTTATPGLLRDLALSTGGREISNPTEAAATLKADIARATQSVTLLLRPAWDRPIFWAILMALLGGEWLLRKLARAATTN